MQETPCPSCGRLTARPFFWFCFNCNAKICIVCSLTKGIKIFCKSCYEDTSARISKYQEVPEIFELHCHNCDQEILSGKYCSENCRLFATISEILLEFAGSDQDDTTDYVNEIFDLFQEKNAISNLKCPYCNKYSVFLDIDGIGSCKNCTG